MQYVGPPCSAQRDCIEGEVCDSLAPAPELGTRCILDETKVLACPPGYAIIGDETTPGALECFPPPPG
jgi:hypothetical protein